MKSGRVGSPHGLGRNDHEKEILIFCKSIQIQFVQKSLALLHNYLETRSSPSGSVVKNLPANVGDMSSIPGSKIPWRKEEMATHSSILAWEIPRTEEPGRLYTVVWGRKSQTELGQHTATQKHAAS